MAKAYIFPGQASQFPGMGKELHEKSQEARERFAQAKEILGFDISALMFDGSEVDLKKTSVTQPAVFIHSVISAEIMSPLAEMEGVAGHSLGEFSALVVNGALTFEDGLELVKQRAAAMQVACDENPGTMAAIVGLEDNVVEEVCAKLDGIVIPANYNCPGQLVISGELDAVTAACRHLTEAGARRAILLAVDGAFHSPLMGPARNQLAEAIENTGFKVPICPIFQNVDGLPSKDPSEIKAKLVAQLTAPVRWTTTINNMRKQGIQEFVEVGGNGKVLRGMIRRIDREITTSVLQTSE